MTNPPPIVYAVMANDEGLVLERVRSGLDINFVDPIRSTAISAATQRGNVSMIKLLLANGADPHVKDRDGKDTFDYIRRYECVEALGVLDDPRFSRIRPIKPKPTMLPEFSSPQDFDQMGGPYSTPVCTITGIAAYPGGGGGVVGDEYILTTNPLIAWRDENGVLHLSELILLRPVLPDSNFTVPARTIVRLTVQLNLKRTRAAVIDADLTPLVDAELSAFLDHYLIPKVVTHPILGTLTENRQYGGYGGTMTLLGKDIDLSFTGELTENALNQACAIVHAPEPFLAHLRKIFATEVLELKNSSWLDDDEKSMTVADVADEAEPGIITVHEDGSLEAWCGGAEWFGGHCVVVHYHRMDDRWSIDLVG